MSPGDRRAAVAEQSEHRTTVVEDRASIHPREHEFVTSRFEHRTTEDGRHHVYTGLQGQEIEACEDEPIHTPGAVQSYGVLVSLRRITDEVYEVVHASENSGDILGLPPKHLFSLRSFTDVLTVDDRETLFDQLDFLDASDAVDQSADAEHGGQDESQLAPEVFLLSGHQADPRAPQWQAWCALHRLRSNDDLYILEFEPTPDYLNPLTHDLGGDTDTHGHVRRHGMDEEGFGGFSDEDLVHSTTSAAKTLRRTRRTALDQDTGSTMQIFSLLSQCSEQLSAQQDLESFLRVVAGLVKDITKFHRVMVYQFDDQWNGQVVTELVDWSRTKDLFQGLFFPATDIPAQARALYKLNKIRVLYDREAPTARLVCRSREALDRPLDLTHSFLRAMSPIHMQYLRNMGVRASFSISITAFGELWGLIACHTYGNVAQRCSFLIRKLCRLLGEQISHNIERLSYASRLTARKVLTSTEDGNMNGYIVSRAEDLLGLFEADSGLLNIADEAKMLTEVGNTQEALVIREYFRQRQLEMIIPSSDLQSDFADLKYASGFKSIAGVLYIPLSANGVDFILFFRRSHLKNVHWAGNPYEKVVEKLDGKTGVLLPRQSFRVWSEAVTTRCKDWSSDQIETAALLRLVYGRFIEIWREKQAALRTSRMASILLRNAGHEVRTPLNAIMNYLELALDGNLDNDVRESLQQSYTASQSLVYVINDLLDLTKVEAGKVLFRMDALDIRDTIRDAVSMYRNQADRKKLKLETALSDDLPPRVLGDRAKLRQVLGNVIANAIAHTDSGSVTVGASCTPAAEETDPVELSISVTDTGCGMSEKKLDEIFGAFESVDASDTRTEHAGLGLATVARVVLNMNGQLRCESKVGRGSVFTFVFRFDVAQVPEQPDGDDTASTLTDAHAADPAKTPWKSAASVTSIASSDHAFPNDASLGRARRSSVRQKHASQQYAARLRDDAARRSRDPSEIDGLVSAMLSNTGSEPSVTRNGAQSASAKATSSVSRSGSIASIQPPSSPSVGQDRRDPDSSPVSPSAEANAPAEPAEASDADSAGPQQLTSTRNTNDLRGVKMQSEDVWMPNRHYRGLGALDSKPTDKAERKSTQAAGGLRVLVAEDDAINRAIIKKRLRMDSHDVVLTNDGLECYEEYTQSGESYDVILMDMQMPNLDGMGAAREIRALEAKTGTSKPTPIIAVSASLTEDQAQEAIDAGIDGWILKPVDFTRLRHLCGGLRNAAAREEDLYAKHTGTTTWNRGGWLTLDRAQ